MRRAQTGQKAREGVSPDVDGFEVATWRSVARKGLETERVNRERATTDHVPELLAITPEGAARWLARKGWRNIGQATRGSWWIAPHHDDQDHDAPAALLPVAGLLDYAKSTAQAVSDIARATGTAPRAIIAEMQADSRIVAECARIVSQS